MSPKKKRLAYSMLTLGIAAAVLPASAAPPRIDAKLTVSLIQFDGTNEVVAPSTAARPGDILEYTTRFVARDRRVDPDWSPTLPIPVGTEYLPASPVPKPTHASVDGIHFEPIPLRRTLQSPDGALRQVDVPMRDYRALRWRLDGMPADGVVVVRARVRVIPVDARDDR